MEMVVDSFFDIGSTHIICEDYAVAGQFNNINMQKLSYAIVADGCSSSDNVDVGARLLAHAAEYNIKNFYRCDDFYINSSVEYMDSVVGESIIKRAKNCLDIIEELPDCALDCTLLYAVSDGENTFIHAHGDGNIVIKYEDYYEVINISFESGAPYYLNYWIHDHRRYNYELYNKEADAKKKIHKSTYDNTGGLIHEEFDTVDNDARFCLKLENKPKSVILFSDGIETYRYFCEDAETKRTHALCYVAEELTAFKNFGQDFAKRRVKAFHRKDKSLEHEDDVSIATIVFKEDK